MNKSAVAQKQPFIKQVLPRWLVTVALGMQIAIVTILLMLSVFFTVTFKRNSPQLGSITEQVDYHFGMPSVAFGLGTIILLGMMILLAIGFSKLPQQWVLAILLIYVAAMQIIWLMSLNLVTYTYPDSRSLMDAADILLNGNINQFGADFCPKGSIRLECGARGIPSAYTYFSYYPFQSGPMLWYLLVFAVFGLDNILAFQIVSAVAVTALVAVLWRFGSLIGLNEKGHGAFTVIVATSVPLLMFATFVYPNAVGFFFTVCGTWMIAEGFRLHKVWASSLAIVGGFLICGIGIVFKSTYQILVLAALVAVIFAVWHNRRVWQLVVSFLSAVAAFFVSKLPVYVVQTWTGQKFGKGMPMSSWIAIGLGQPDNMPAGWWSRFAIDAFERTGNDYALQSQISNDFVRNRLAFFAGNPSDGLNFFTNKLASEWAEPSFMTSLYSELGESANHFSGLGSFLLLGKGADVLLRFENVAQTVVYFLAIIGVIGLVHSLMKERSLGADSSQVFTRVLLCTSFIGGFLCYLFWEAKSIYTLPFFLLLFPVAAYGIQNIADLISSIKKKIA